MNVGSSEDRWSALENSSVLKVINYRAVPTFLLRIVIVCFLEASRASKIS